MLFDKIIESSRRIMTPNIHYSGKIGVRVFFKIELNGVFVLVIGCNRCKCLLHAQNCLYNDSKMSKSMLRIDEARKITFQVRPTNYFTNLQFIYNFL